VEGESAAGTTPFDAQRGARCETDGVVPDESLADLASQVIAFVTHNAVVDLTGVYRCVIKGSQNSFGYPVTYSTVMAVSFEWR
jgi:hypothetical protein